MQHWTSHHPVLSPLGAEVRGPGAGAEVADSRVNTKRRDGDDKDAEGLPERRRETARHALWLLVGRPEAGRSVRCGSNSPVQADLLEALLRH